MDRQPDRRHRRVTCRVKTLPTSGRLTWSTTGPEGQGPAPTPNAYHCERSGSHPGFRLLTSGANNSHVTTWPGIFEWKNVHCCSKLVLPTALYSKFNYSKYVLARFWFNCNIYGGVTQAQIQEKNGRGCRLLNFKSGSPAKILDLYSWFPALLDPKQSMKINHIPASILQTQPQVDSLMQCQRSQCLPQYPTPKQCISCLQDAETWIIRLTQTSPQPEKNDCSLQPV